MSRSDLVADTALVDTYIQANNRPNCKWSKFDVSCMNSGAFRPGSLRWTMRS
jgi:hypothetical protein